MLSKMRKEVVEYDKVVIIDENGTADIATVYEQDDQALFAESAQQDYAVPIADVKSYVGGRGRIYVLKADSDYIRDTIRLAALEKSVVLRQVTQFTHPEKEKQGMNIKSILMYAMIAVLLLAVIFK